MEHAKQLPVSNFHKNKDMSISKGVVQVAVVKSLIELHMCVQICTPNLRIKK